MLTSEHTAREIEQKARKVMGMAIAVPFISCRKIADSMVKSKNRDKNTT